MKKGKLSLFVVALTLSVSLSTGVYAAQHNKNMQGTKPNAVAHKMDSRNAKTKQWDEKFVKNHENNQQLSESKVASRDAKNEEWAKKYAENHKIEVEDKDTEVALTAEQKVVIQAQKDKIAAVKDANKVLETEMIKNAEAVKAELKRIEDAKLVVDPTVKAEADLVSLAVNYLNTKEDFIKPVVDPTELGVEATKPVVDPTELGVEATKLGVEPTEPVVEPTKLAVEPTELAVEPTEPVVEPTEPVDKTYFEKLNERLDSILKRVTEKNTELTYLGTKLTSLLNTLIAIK